MAELSPTTREALTRVGTSTLSGILNRRGLRNMAMQEVWPIRAEQPRLVGLFPAASDDAKRDFAAWKKGRGIE